MSSRAQALVDMWNAGNLDAAMGFYADDHVLVAIGSNTAPDRPVVELNGKEALRRSLERLSTAMPRFELMGAMESHTCMSLILKDSHGEQLTVAIDFDADGQIAKTVSVRTRYGR